MWQQCPICYGEGRVVNYPATTSSTHKICPTCNGARIIDQVTGLPPAFPVKEEYQNPTTTNVVYDFAYKGIDKIQGL